MDNAFSNTDSFNTNDNCFNNNDNSFNTNSFNKTTINYTTSDDRLEILAWLSPLEPRVRHRDIGARRINSIGAWLPETEEFKCWYGGNDEDGSYHPTLFCDGNPGVGKSYIISLVIDKLGDEAVDGDPTVACFYFDFAARSEQSPVNMLGSLLRQLVGGEEEIHEAVAKDFRKEKKAIGGRGLQVSGILKIFQTIIARRRAFICVDALDECVPEHRIVILESLGHILQRSPNTRLFMTGRPHVRSEVERWLDGAVTLINIRATEDEVRRLLSEKLRKDTIPNMMSSALEGDIMKCIPAISSETFLLASLHIEATLKSIKDGAGLGDAYGATLERIKAQDEEKEMLAMAALTWVCHAERLLQVGGLCHALGVETGAAAFDPENVPSIGTLLDCCRGLITVDAEASNVRLIHYTVQEYLCSYPGLFSKPHSILAETCLTYLNSEHVNNLSFHSLSGHGNMPFLKYSSRYWGIHTNKGLSDNGRALALELLYQYEDHISAVSLLEQVLPPGSIGGIATPLLFSGLHCASFFGIVDLVTVLINVEGHEVDQQDCAGRTAFAWAARNGNEGVVKILLERENIDPNRSDTYSQTPLGWAAIAGHEGVVKLLLERENVDPNRPHKHGRTPLGCAAVRGHEAVVKILLQQENVDPNRPDMDGDGPLVCAAICGHEGVVKLLLEREYIDPNQPDSDDRTPLWHAAFEGHERVVKLLLEREDVDPNRPDKDGEGPLRCAAFKGHEEVVKLLLERENVDPNQPDMNDLAPFWSAIMEGHEAVVKLLLERGGVDPNQPGVDDRTPLGWTSKKGREGVVKLLLEQGCVDPDHSDKRGGTPLAYAAKAGHGRIVQLLQARKSIEVPDAGARRDGGRDVSKQPMTLGKRKRS